MIIFIGLISCKSSSNSWYPKTSEKTYERWDSEKAQDEAINDIKNGTIKIYYSGGYAAEAVGIAPSDYDLISNLPKEDAGIGCVIYDMKLRELQHNYAMIYNKEIMKWLKEGKKN